MEILNHLLSDMAFFYGITKTNTLDIIDALIEMEVFTKESGKLLKESIATIYAIRIRLHSLYKEQKEEGSTQPHPQYKQLLPFEISCFRKMLLSCFAPIICLP